MNFPTLSDEILFGRPTRWKIFVSSKMNGDPLKTERETVIHAIESTSLAHAWCWERQARAGEFCAEGVCIGHARTSDGLVLILGDTLTPITHREYVAAGEAHAARFILIQDGVSRDDDAREFIRRERERAVTKNFANLSEVRKHIIGALNHHAVNSARQQQLARLGQAPPRRIHHAHHSKPPAAGTHKK